MYLPRLMFIHEGCGILKVAIDGGYEFCKPIDAHPVTNAIEEIEANMFFLVATFS